MLKQGYLFTSNNKFNFKKLAQKIKIIYKKDKSYNNLVGSNLKLSKTGWKHKDSLNKIINEFYKKKIKILVLT